MTPADYVLPRYVFRQTGVGCGQAGHAPACLCDVNITTPVPIYRGNLMFGAMALAEVDADTVSPRNLLAFASVLLGCHQEYLRCPPADETPYVGHNPPQAVVFDRERARWQALGVKQPKAHQHITPHSVARNKSAVALGKLRVKQPIRSAPDEWFALGEDVRAHLQFHWACGTPWCHLEHLVAPEVQVRLRLYYNKKAAEYRGGVKYAEAGRKVRTRPAPMGRKVSCESR